MGKGIMAAVALAAVAAVGYMVYSGATTGSLPGQDGTAAVAPQADGVIERATEGAQEATAATENAATGASDTATGAVEGATEMAEGAEEMLTLEGFDYETVLNVIERSDLGTVEKTTLSAALNNARDDPQLLGEVLSQVRTALDQ